MLSCPATAAAGWLAWTCHSGGWLSGSNGILQCSPPSRGPLLGPTWCLSCPDPPLPDTQLTCSRFQGLSMKKQLDMKLHGIEWWHKWHQIRSLSSFSLVFSQCFLLQWKTTFITFPAMFLVSSPNEHYSCSSASFVGAHFISTPRERKNCTHTSCTPHTSSSKSAALIYCSSPSPLCTHTLRASFYVVALF